MHFTIIVLLKRYTTIILKFVKFKYSLYFVHVYINHNNNLNMYCIYYFNLYHYEFINN